MPSNNVVELDARCPSNRNPRFRPLNITFRGDARVDEARGKNLNTAYQTVAGEIPGDRIILDLDQKSLTVVDRMTLKENKAKDEALKTLAETSEDHWQCRYGRHKPDQTYQASDKEWPTWLWFIRRMVDDEKLAVVTGKTKLPEWKEILAMCDHERGIVVKLGDSCGLKPEDKDRPFYQLDERDIEEPNEALQPT